MNETYDVLIAYPDSDFPETFMDWHILTADKSFIEATEAIDDCIYHAIKDGDLVCAYRVVRHGEGGNFI